MLTLAHIMKKRIICVSSIDFINMQITLRQMEIFAAIAKTENVTRAVQLHVANTDAVVERLLRFECDLGRNEYQRVALAVHPLTNRWSYCR